MSEQEHLATVTIEGKSDIVFTRRGKDTEITRDGKTVTLKKSSGMQTLGILILLEDLGKIVTEDEE